MPFPESVSFKEGRESQYQVMIITIKKKKKKKLIKCLKIGRVIYVCRREREREKMEKNIVQKWFFKNSFVVSFQHTTLYV